MFYRKGEKTFNLFQKELWFSRVCSTTTLKKQGKGEIARGEQFLLFPQCFYPFRELSVLFIKSKISSANSSSLEDSEMSFGKGLTSIFSFLDNVLRRFLPKGSSNLGLCGKGLQKSSFSQDIFSLLGLCPRIPTLVEQCVFYKNRKQNAYIMSPV